MNIFRRKASEPKENSFGKMRTPCTLLPSAHIALMSSETNVEVELPLSWPTAAEYRAARDEVESEADAASAVRRRGTLSWSHIRMLRFRALGKV